MPYRRARFWKGVAVLAAIPPVLGLLVPPLRAGPVFLALMQLGAGTLIAVGVGATVVRFRVPGGYPGPATRGQAERLYRSQLRVGAVMSVVLLGVLGAGVWVPRLSALRRGAWLLLPMVFIAPVLHLRDRSARAVRRRS